MFQYFSHQLIIHFFRNAIAENTFCVENTLCLLQLSHGQPNCHLTIPQICQTLQFLQILLQNFLKCVDCTCLDMTCYALMCTMYLLVELHFTRHIYITCALHYTLRALEVYYNLYTCILHVQYMYTTCILNVHVHFYYLYTTCMLRVYYM